MNPPTEPPPGLIAVPMKGAVLLLTEQEYLAGIRRGKSWRRRVALQQRLRLTVELQHTRTADGDPPA